MSTPSTTEDPATRYNSMPPAWCAARLAEARAWASDVDADPAAARTHVIELLSQIDRPPLVAAAVEGATDFVVLPAEQRAKIKRFAEVYQPCQYGKLPSQRVGEYIAAKTDYEMAVGPDVALGTLAYVEHLEAENRRLTTEAADATDAMAKLGGAGWLINLLRYCSSEDLDYIFDKLSRRCPAGKAMATDAQDARERAGMQEVQIADLQKRNELLAESGRQDTREIAALRAKLAHEGEQEAQLLKRDEELRGLTMQLHDAWTEARDLEYEAAAARYVDGPRLEKANAEIAEHYRLKRAGLLTATDDSAAPLHRGTEGKEVGNG